MGFYLMRHDGHSPRVGKKEKERERIMEGKARQGKGRQGRSVVRDSAPPTFFYDW